jgi:starch synthase (maltosyl-transferring)
MPEQGTIASIGGESTLPEGGRRRVVIEVVSPEIDGGRFPVKRVVGEPVTVEADVFSDGHDEVAATLLWKREGEDQWREVPFRFLCNDRWRASFVATEPGRCIYTVHARIDRFATWRKDLRKRFEAGSDLRIDLLIGASLVEEAEDRAESSKRERLQSFAAALRDAASGGDALALADSGEMASLMDETHDPELDTIYPRELEVTVEPEIAMFGAWYELFPRSCGTEGVDHGSFADCERLLPTISAMGFDVVYFPPIHPIGRTNRKGKNNSITAEAEDPGSPWAIGSPEGGHMSVHPALGSNEEFDHFIASASRAGLKVAMDIAFQCSPDHPYVREHPHWFRWRPDGTVQYAENPPKKYQDIIPFDFETKEWRSLWAELLSVVTFWIDRGITVFRVDNPHTKPFPFWEWLIREVKRRNPEVVFLSEAFTRPKVMYRLAKLGFSQSYTYFSWRNTRWELEHYMKELTATEVREYFRPNFWPNTPDILPEFLQFGGRTAFVIRFLLASTLSASYGIYGPPFDLFVNDALPDSEEYLDSEKFEIRRWNWNEAANMRHLFTLVNRIRRENRAMHSTWNVRFCESDNEQIIAFMKRDDEGSNTLLVCISLDPFNDRKGMVRLPVEGLGISPGHPFLMEDLLSGEKCIWYGERNSVELSATSVPAKIFMMRPRMRRENDFDYFM